MRLLLVYCYKLIDYDISTRTMYRSRLAGPRRGATRALFDNRNGQKWVDVPNK
jgi:hypothetical protein